MILTGSCSKYFSYAKSAALMSGYPRVRVGCVAMYGNKVISIGFNMEKTHPLQKYYNKYRNFQEYTNVHHRLHAEVNCLSQIMDMDINWRKVDLYIYRLCISREHGVSRPCPSCMRLIQDLGIKNIYYTTDAGFAHEIVDSIQVSDAV